MVLSKFKIKDNAQILFRSMGAFAVGSVPRHPINVHFGGLTERYR